MNHTCPDCGETIAVLDLGDGPEWLHVKQVEPIGGAPSIAAGVMTYRHCQNTAAEPT